ncbi:hypothetical protein FRC00_008417, partial [Tulasnella sp. 408]
MSLKRLTLWTCEDVDQILRNQPELEELEVGWRTSGVDQLDETDLPKLKFLAAPLHEAAFIVPGRPIEGLRIIRTPDDEGPFDDQLFENFALSTGPITDLSVHLLGMSEEDDESFDVDERLRVGLQVISRNLTQLESLSLH